MECDFKHGTPTQVRVSGKIVKSILEIHRCIQSQNGPSQDYQKDGGGKHHDCLTIPSETKSLHLFQHISSFQDAHVFTMFPSSRFKHF